MNFLKPPDLGDSLFMRHRHYISPLLSYHFTLFCYHVLSVSADSIPSYQDFHKPPTAIFIFANQNCKIARLNYLEDFESQASALQELCCKLWVIYRSLPSLIIDKFTLCVAISSLTQTQFYVYKSRVFRYGNISSCVNLIGLKFQQRRDDLRTGSF